ncbi:MAG: Spy/CpxP family protein refolding chaperone [Curvibacter lanceolatus]|jgi:hypothetical protein|uniref:Spy/CpxP family protein refolding chaperone n=1 Tax=Curvibacter lanceolatus TaxID=86182 RepID=UPI00235277A6|nr:Spy/CpxP family protein refolding chaperone [Curvibacter lanceolatus]MBV5291044.1 Spy/CpxP family protein refolding chaperone [Curvibacter lanceolatus]
MKILFRSPSLISFGLALWLAGATAHAQMGGVGGGMGGGMGGGGGRGAGPGSEAAASPRAEGFVSPAARLNQFADQLVTLRLRLQLEGAQNAAWNTFQRKAGDWAAEVFRSRYANTEETALQALERRANDAHRRQALLDALLNSARQLDELLRPEQRSQFDQQLPALLP